MKDPWEHELSCAVACNRCNAKLAAGDQRILSVVDHQPICLACKRAEEKQPDMAIPVGIVTFTSIPLPVVVDQFSLGDAHELFFG